MMKVLVCGSRNWTWANPIREALKELAKDHDAVTVVHGACRGVDRLAAKLAKEEFGFEVKSYPADWTKYGRSAGPIRNQQMLDEEHPDKVLALHLNLEGSRGTKNMLDAAVRAGIPAFLYAGRGWRVYK